MGKITDSIANSTNDNIDVQRRRFPRRSTDTCLITVNGVPYPVKDWSLSGVLFEADTRTFSQGETLPMVLKFNVGDMMATVDVNGAIVRKNARFIATQFEDLSSKAQQTLHEVIDKSDLLQQAQTGSN